ACRSFLFFLLHSSCDHRYLLSFPTRRSSDLLVVFEILADSKCNGCGKALWKGEFLFLDGEQPLCMSCADFDHLVYLPRGDAALRSEEHTSELQSRENLVCRLLLEKKKKMYKI